MALAMAPLSSEMAPDDPKPSRWARILNVAWPLACGAAFGVIARLAFKGQPGQPYAPMMSSFVLLVPVAVGAIAVIVGERLRRHSWSQYFLRAALANLLFVLGTVIVGVEGLICVIVIAPLFAVIGGLAGLLMGLVCRKTAWPRQAAYVLVVLPFVFGAIEQQLPLPNSIRSVERSRLVAARPGELWPHLAIARDIRPEEIDSAWMYRIGVPVPLSAVTDVRDGSSVRHITMGKGIHFDQVAADWIPNRRVRWLYRFSADSFPPNALDDHVRIGGAYFGIIDTEYALAKSGDVTRLTARMTYRLTTSFNWYAGPLAEFLVGNFEEAALAFYARRAEADARKRIETG